MKILIIHPCKGFYGGAEEVVAQLHDYLKHPHLSWIVTKDAPSELLKDRRFYNSNSWLDFYKSAREEIRHADVACCFNFPATLATFPTRKPIVWYCNEPPELFTSWKRKPLEAFNRWWVKQSHMKCVVATKADATRFQRLYKVAPSILPYGIDYDFWSAPSTTQRAKDLTILQVGHSELFPEGNKVLGELVKTVPNVGILRLSGEPREQVRDAYHKAHILFHPVSSHGGFLAPFEAMCAGLPVVASVNFAAADLIRKAGMLAALPTPDEYAKAILTIYRHYDNFSNSQLAKDFVKNNLTWQRFGEGMLRIFEETLK